MTTTSVSAEPLSSNYYTPSSLHSFTRRHSIYGTEDRVVLDVGSMYIKCGFSGESQPRHIVPTWSHLERAANSEGEAFRVDGKMTELYNLNLMVNSDLSQLKEKLKRLLHDIYFRLLLTDPKSRKVILCESPLAPLVLKQTLATLLFEYFQVPSLSFVPIHLTALLTTGLTTGLVVDVGHLETSVLPVYATRPLTPFITTTPLAGRAVTERLRHLLKEHARYIPPTHLHLSLAPQQSVPDNILTLERLEDIKSRTLVILPRSDSSHDSVPDTKPESSRVMDMYYPIPVQDEKAMLLIPGWLRERATDILFEGDEEDEPSVAHSVLDALLKVQPDLRKPLATSLLLAGGTTAVPGFQARLEQELVRIMQTPNNYEAKRYSALRRLDRHLAFVGKDNGSGRLFKPNVRGWVGASLMGSLKLSGEEMAREKFAGTVHDWSIGHWSEAMSGMVTSTSTTQIATTTL